MAAHVSSVYRIVEDQIGMEKELEAKRLLTVSEVAELTGWSKHTIRGKIANRKIEFIRLDGRSIRIELSTVQRLIDQGRVPALPERR